MTYTVSTHIHFIVRNDALLQVDIPMVFNIQYSPINLKMILLNIFTNCQFLYSSFHKYLF